MRGIAAHRAAVTAKTKGWAIETQTENSAKKNRGASHAGGIFRRRGRGRINRIEMLDEHRQFVEELREDAIEHELNIIPHTPPLKLPMLSEGI